jgi:hypothetical protein
MSLVAAAPAPVHHAASQTTHIGPFTPETLVIIVLALVMWVVVYMLYKTVMTKRKDFGMPVRRRILCKRLRVDKDQSADVPFWWTDLQIQIAIGSHWKQSLRAPLEAGREGHAPV